MRNVGFFLVIVLSSMLFLTSLVLAPARAASPLEVAMQATLVIRSDDLEETLLGSGFRFQQPGIAITNAHVVGAARRVLVIAEDGSRQVAHVVAVDVLRDIAVLEISPQGRFLVAETVAAYLGQPVFALGNPFGINFSLSRGVVSALARQIEANVPLKMLQHDAAVNPGSSGGPLVNAQGHLLGMNSQIADGFRHYIGVSYAIPVTLLTRVVGDLLAGRNQGIAPLGLRVRPVTPKIAQALGLAAPGGVLVDHVTADGLAAASGIQPGDVLLSLGGKVLKIPGDLAFALDVSPSEMMVFKLHRGGKTVRVQLARVSDITTDLEVTSRGLPQKIRSYSLRQIGLKISQIGAVEAVEPGSLVQYLGLSVGDVVLALNGNFETDFLGYKITRPTLALIRLSDGSTRHFMLDPWQKPGRLMPVGGANILDTAIVLF